MWTTLSCRVVKCLGPALKINDSLVWILSEGDQQAQKDSPYCWAEIRWCQNGEIMATLPSIYISEHQIEPNNIESYVRLITDSLKRKKEEATLATA